MNRAERSKALAELYARMSKKHSASTPVPEREKEDTDVALHHVDAASPREADVEFFTEAKQILESRD